MSKESKIIDEIKKNITRIRLFLNLPTIRKMKEFAPIKLIEKELFVWQSSIQVKDRFGSLKKKFGKSGYETIEQVL